MPRRLIPLAIAYDFDGTLAPGNMQEHDFIPKIGMTKRAFWKEVGALSKSNEADNILVYMKLMLERAQAAHVPVRKSDFESFGATLELFSGVLGWFDRINAYGRAGGVRVEHYVISSGIREMVLGSPISRKFRAVFASSFMYDHHGVAQWPALVLNYTTKTQYLFRINKGSLHVHDHSKINEYSMVRSGLAAVLVRRTRCHGARLTRCGLRSLPSARPKLMRLRTSSAEHCYRKLRDQMRRPSSSRDQATARNCFASASPCP